MTSLGAGATSVVHTHSQADVANLVTDLAAKAAAVHGHAIADVALLQAALDAKELAANKGLPNGYAGLGVDGKVPAAQLPASGGGSDGEVSLYKSADQSISTQGWTDVTGLSFAVTAGKAYLIEAYVLFQSSATAMGVWLGVNGPASPTLCSLRSRKEITAAATAGTDKFSEAVLTAYNTANPASTAEPNQATNLLWELRGVFIPSADGTFALRFNKENVAGTATIKAGSWLRYRVLN